MKPFLALISLLSLSSLLLVGCGADDNPVTPEKMQTIRKKQSDEMKQLAQSGSTPEKPPTK